MSVPTTSSGPMAETMVERVAREMFREWHESGRHIPPPFPTDRFERLRWLLGARAVIEAMREPTEAMERAGNAVWDDPMHEHINGEIMWAAMINAALAEGKREASPPTRYPVLGGRWREDSE